MKCGWEALMLYNLLLLIAVNGMYEEKRCFESGLPTISDGWNYVCLKFDVQSFEAKNRVFKFDYQQMNMFESVLRSKK